MDHLHEKLRHLEGNGRPRPGEAPSAGALDDLLAENRCLMAEIENLRRDAAQSRREREAAVEEAQQFRDDVKFLTHETETMLMELKTEAEEKMRVERELRKAQRELEELQHAPHVQDKIQINTLRSLNEIIDRDKQQLVEQIQGLLQEKNELMNSLDARIGEGTAMHEARQAVERDNEMLVKERQNLRYQI